MRVVSLNQDRGIDPARKKGAAVHLEAMRTAFREAGHRVHSIDIADEELAREALVPALGNGDLLYERYALGRDLGSRVCRELGVPHVIELNAPLAEEERKYRGGNEDAGLERRERDIFSSAAVVLAVSEQVGVYAKERGAASKTLLVRPNGVDAKRFVPRTPGDPLRLRLVPDDRFVLGFHGRLRPWHGIELLGQAASTLLEQGYPIHLVLVGEGEFESGLGPGVPRERVTRVPWVPHAEMPGFVATFDALPLTYSPNGPSYFSPLKLAEAMACGVVPVFPGLGDLPRLLADGRDSLRYSAGDPTDLASKLARLMDDPLLCSRLAKSAAQSAQTRSWRSIADDVIEALRSGRWEGLGAESGTGLGAREHGV